jgi:hypothetical protein
MLRIVELQTHSKEYQDQLHRLICGFKLSADDVYLVENSLMFNSYIQFILSSFKKQIQ